MQDAVFFYEPICLVSSKYKKMNTKFITAICLSVIPSHLDSGSLYRCCIGGGLRVIIKNFIYTHSQEVKNQEK